MIDSVDVPEAAPGPSLKKPRRRSAATAGLETSSVDRLPPHSIEAEQGVLACVLLAPQECLGECIERFGRKNWEPEAGPGRDDPNSDPCAVFYDLRHREIYRVLLEMYEAKAGIDLITLQQRLKDRNQLEAVGGLEYLASLPDKVPSSANLKYYADIVWDKFFLRRIIRTCNEVVGQIYEYEGEVDALVDQVETQILRISEDKEAGRASAVTVRDLVHEAIERIEEYHTNQGLLTGLPTGFADFDKLTTGLHGGEMIVIAARPSMGKTSLAMNIAEHVSIDHKLPVAVFSLEMSAPALVLRILCSRSKVNLRRIREGFFSERDFPKLTGAAGKLAAAPLFIDDTSGLSILQLRAKARRLWQQHGIKLFVIDYLQLLHSTSRRADNRQQEIADISSGVKGLAKELNVPVIVLSQLNRELERDKSRKPRLSDLRESGAIEQDADLVGLLYKPGSDEEEESTEQEGVAVRLCIAKQRNGPTGDIDLTFLKPYTRFESAAKVSAEDVPTES
jgi:replicative DNA helicase